MVRLESFLNSKLSCWLKKNWLCFMHVLLNLQGLHSTSHFLLVILLVYWYNLSARLWLLWSSILQAPHIHLRPAQLPTSLCATERRIQQQEKWWSSSSQQKNQAISGWQLVCTLRVLRPVLFNRYRHVSMIRREEVNTPLTSWLLITDWEVLFILLRDKMPCRGM